MEKVNFNLFKLFMVLALVILCFGCVPRGNRDVQVQVEDDNQIILNSAKDLVPPGLSLLFKDEFSGKKLTQWNNISGNWGIRKGRLLQTRENLSDLPEGFQIITLKGITGEDYSVETLVKLEKSKQNASAGVILRYKDPFNYYLARLVNNYAYQDTVSLYAIVEGQPLLTLAKKNIALNSGQWYFLRAEVQGQTINIYLNEKLQVTINDAKITAGGVGLATRKAKAVFDDFAVRTLGDIKSLAAEAEGDEEIEEVK